MTSPLRFRPIYRERVWGGRELATFLGRELPEGLLIGESWELVDRPEAQSIVADGPDKGRSLRELIARDPAAIMGPGWPGNRPFPLLVKWLDCRQRLSVQIHPPASVAARLGGEPKTENWYFARTDPGAAVYAGLRRGVTRESLAHAIAAGTVEQCLERLSVQAGDSLLIPSGTVHAIDGGTVILEIQQNSDTTYRVFDWNRSGLDGRPRPLHVPESLESLPAPGGDSPRLIRGEGAGEVLAHTREFRILCRRLAPGDRLSFPAGQESRILSLVEGALEGGTGVKRGDVLLLPCAATQTFVAITAAVVLVAEGFSTP